MKQVKSSEIPERFIENLGVMTEEIFKKIQEAKVIIIGLGGIGGNIANNLVRLGVCNFMLVDYDQFTISNLNRQLFSSTENIGRYKAEVVKEQIIKINPSSKIKVFIHKIQEMNKTDLNDYDYIIDAVDNPKSKIFIAELGSQLNIPVLHGACAGWYLQVGWIEPNCNLIQELYEEDGQGLEAKLKNPSFTPAATASIMTSEFLKYVTRLKQATVNQLVMVDLLNSTIIKTNDSDNK